MTAALDLLQTPPGVVLGGYAAALALFAWVLAGMPYEPRPGLLRGLLALPLIAMALWSGATVILSL